MGRCAVGFFLPTDSVSVLYYGGWIDRQSP